ncbi:UMP-CMP kinase (macronuclear) [Tetrahymena thermophila SB210]|uniref:UMP-CMP kinase n=1 Tax=Tetrahymena thermophila (strain SB210) TaxID=312017 RepID=Q23BW1_TETTS|nr:UMP-CMP kinase [Tetrahymena thermophila SB210]EAR94007.1 UMP-CMP kinase [Tetrahymena thermophila SB210]|eukprot:XP_001014252.1 UMP-CMP kinase [Tetrahymena thermophila SB210]
MAEEKPAVAFILGGPGSGKGTQCQKLVNQYGLVHLSAGDLLREERASGSKDAELIESIIREGKIVPSEITVKLLKNAMEKNGWAKSKFLIDGFPRSQDNLDGWNQMMGHLINFKFVLFLDCSEDIMTQRIMKRAESSGRSDDNIESLKKRFRTYIESTKPIIDFYAKQNKVITVNAEKSIDEVFEKIRPHFTDF